MKRLLFFPLFFSLFFFTSSIHAGELTGETYWSGLKTSFNYLSHGSTEQFQEKNNLVIAAAFLPAFWFSFDQDTRISNNARTKPIPKSIQLTSDLAPILGLPLISLATFTYGIKNDNPKLVQFSEEYFGAMYLAFIESAALSLINVHERPSSAKLAKIETSLRGKSSFPSGHVIPFATLAFKTFQFYGAYAAIAPTALMVMTSIQRVRDGKHYLSDIVGGVFLSITASEGVRKAAQYSENDSLYKTIFERNVSVGIIEHHGVYGPQFVFNWD
jgi:undecaprenyl-diphosphatase